MRRISKRWPPSNVSPDDQAPSSMADAEQELLTSLPGAADPARHARGRFDSLDKKKLRLALYAEQRHLCVYCEREVTEGPPAPHIDHWRPLSENPKLALRWDNLYLSCPATDTCDGAKGEHRLACEAADPDLPWPKDAPYHEWIGFTSGGEAYVRADAGIDDATRRALELAIAEQPEGVRARRTILNLNKDALVTARKAAIDNEMRRMNADYPGKHASREERHARADKMLARKQYPSFVSIRVAYLKKTLGKHQP